MQKVFRYLFLSVLVVFLTGCSFTKKASENGISGNNDVDVKIKGGTYVLPNDESSDSKYLALNVEIKNKSDKKLRLSEGDIHYIILMMKKLSHLMFMIQMINLKQCHLNKFLKTRVSAAMLSLK